MPELGKSLKLVDIQAEWDTMPVEARERFREEARRQLAEQGQEKPTARMVEPRMFKLFWAERKGLSSEPGPRPKSMIIKLDEETDGK